MWTGRILILLAAVCSAGFVPYADRTTYNFLGTSTALNVQIAENNTAVMLGLYQDCSATSPDGERLTGNVCMAHLVSCLLQAIGSVADGSRTTAVVNSTTIAVHPRGIGMSRRSFRSKQSSEHDDIPSAARYGKTPMGPPPPVHAVEVVASEVHPHDGHAIRMNVRSTHGALHVHTNGTHAVAQFDNGRPDAGGRHKREESDAGGYHFDFSGAEGMKIQAHGLHNDQTASYTQDLVAFAYGLAYGRGGTVELQQGDSFAYSICELDTGVRLSYGQLVAETRRFRANYEELDVSHTPSC